MRQFIPSWVGCHDMWDWLYHGLSMTFWLVYLNIKNVYKKYDNINASCFPIIKQNRCAIVQEYSEKNNKNAEIKLNSSSGEISNWQL